MKNRILFLVLTLVSTFVFSQTDKRLKGIEKQFNAVLESTKAAGFAVAIVEGDKIIYAKGFGYADYENKIPADANTLFAIGSSTKAFTSALLGLHREDDKLTFDDRPRKYIPELEFYNDEMDNTIIIKDLMRHSTGLPRHDASWYYFPSHNKDSLVTKLKYHEPFTGVREHWYYNNFGFLLQGVITERITGKTWEENIETEFFKPLGMDRSKTTIAGMKSSSNAAFGYELDADRNITKMDYYDIAGMSPAGSINSSVNDMTKWLMTWINKGKYNDQQIIPEDYVKEAMSSQMVVAAGFPSKELPDAQFANYGYGWFLHSYKGHYLVEHGGNIDGFSASVALYPSDSLGIVVLTNQNGSPVPRLIRNITADYMLNVDKTEWAKKYKEDLEKSLEVMKEAKDEAETSNVKNTRPSHTKLDYTGTYEEKGYGKFEIEIENDSLFSKLNGKKIFLNHFHYDTFELLEVKNGKVDTTDIGNSVKINFSTNFVGDIDYGRMDIEGLVDPIAFKRTPNTIDVDAKTLEQYVGKYDLMGTEIKAYIKDENVLYVFVPGQPEYALIPTAEHKFNFKTLEGFKIEFLESDDKNINEVKFIQPNGTFVAKRKLEE
ncbi:serine hydrolase [Winogradskyella thalassocola]|uniref:CubicO group peptidase, beta-lactamase class C family n=1 Tax=Winogradskyella thalassocola TaxID=262004 RepID=A0A1G8LVE6_9FLAO|nr:serine hydrolase [Winogradskyella thalassocola]SDI59692.1 CubicO group peptidase, beta-lactamase class C family [Winogradskyella thalassocola]